jgi:hypothetical protein
LTVDSVEDSQRVAGSIVHRRINGEITSTEAILALQDVKEFSGVPPRV